MLVVRLLRKHGFDFLISPLASEPRAAAASTSAQAQTASQSSPLRPSIDTLGFRKVLYSSVLATDMSLHFAWIARLKDFGARLQSDPDPDSQAAEEEGEENDRIMISQAIIKCADISNPVRPLSSCSHLERHTPLQQLKADAFRFPLG